MTLTLKDPSKEAFLLELLASFDYVEVTDRAEESDDKRTEAEKDYDFFEAAGMWKDRDIDADQLRKDAWSRS